MIHFSISRTDLRKHSWKCMSYDKLSVKLSSKVQNIIDIILEDVRNKIMKEG